MRKRTMLLSALLTPYIAVPAFLDREITGLSQVSSEVMPGDLFFARRGKNADGEQFISEAITRGAVAVVRCCHPEERSSEGSPDLKHDTPIFNLPQHLGSIASRFYSDPSHQMKVIGVTGTSGKTSCTHYIAHALTQLAFPTAVFGTLGFSMQEIFFSSTHTTAEPIPLQQQLSYFLSQGAKAIAMEVSSHALVQHRVAGVQFHTGVFTNLSHEHLDYHHTFENYAAAKYQLFEQPGMKYAVINIDDPVGQSWVKKLSGSLDVITTSIERHPAATLRAEDIVLSSSGISATIHSPWGSTTLQSQLQGRFNVANLLTSIASLLTLGLPFEPAVQAVATAPAVAGRLQVLGGGDKPRVVVDYAHKPNALMQVLQTLREQCQGKLWCVFGCGGDRDAAKRPMMGAIAERESDYVIITNDNPRSEVPSNIASEILAGIAHPQKVQVVLDRRQAIETAVLQAKPEDVILIAGKGHETYQLVGTETFSFNDVNVVKEIMERSR